LAAYKGKTRKAPLKITGKGEERKKKTWGKRGNPVPIACIYHFVILGRRKKKKARKRKGRTNAWLDYLTSDILSMT